MYELNVMPLSNSAVFDGCYFLCYCFQKAENCTKCSNYPTLSTFEFDCLLWVKSYANEQNCKQWRQQRFAYWETWEWIECNDTHIDIRACLHEGGGPQVGEVTCGGSPHLTCKRDHIKMRDYMDRRVTSPIWGPPLYVNRPLVCPVPTRSTLILVTIDFFWLVTNLNDKNNVCKQWCLL